MSTKLTNGSYRAINGSYTMVRSNRKDEGCITNDELDLYQSGMSLVNVADINQLIHEFTNHSIVTTTLINERGNRN
jgi:hypothetical protein